MGAVFYVFLIIFVLLCAHILRLFFHIFGSSALSNAQHNAADYHYRADYTHCRYRLAQEYACGYHGNKGINIYVCIHFAVYLKQTQDCKSIIFQ